MDRQLDRIRQAYDLTVDQHRRGVDPLDLVPADLRNSPELRRYFEVDEVDTSHVMAKCFRRSKSHVVPMAVSTIVSQRP